MQDILKHWQANTGKFKLHIALAGIFLVGALFAYGGASWYYTGRLNSQDRQYGVQITALSRILDERAQETMGKLDTLSERLEFLTEEVSKIAERVSRAGKTAGTAATKAGKAAETAQDAAEAVKEAVPTLTPAPTIKKPPASNWGFPEQVVP